MPVRKALGFPTIFNLLGPLTNPAGATRQVIGVYNPALTQMLANVLKQLGSVDALVACGLPTVEVHLSNIQAREPFRKVSVISEIAVGVVSGFGPESYRLGLQALLDHLRKS